MKSPRWVVTLALLLRPLPKLKLLLSQEQLKSITRPKKSNKSSLTRSNLRRLVSSRLLAKTIKMLLSTPRVC